MTQRVCRYVPVPFVPAFAFLALTGCGLGGGNDLPPSVTVELPDGTTVEADKGDGVPSLKNSTWDFSRTASSDRLHGKGQCRLWGRNRRPMLKFERS